MMVCLKRIREAGQHVHHNSIMLQHNPIGDPSAHRGAGASAD
jgi:hypothetical protein